MPKRPPSRKCVCKRYNRHPKPPSPSKLTPSQYAKLRRLIGAPPFGENDFLIICREFLADKGHGEFTADDLIDEALLRLILGGKLPKKMKFPTTEKAFVDAVKRLGELHAKNALKRHHRKGLRPISFENSHYLEMLANSTPLQSTSLQDEQLKILQRLEEKLIKRISNIKLNKDATASSSLAGTDTAIELF